MRLLRRHARAGLVWAHLAIVMQLLMPLADASWHAANDPLHGVDHHAAATAPQQGPDGGKHGPGHAGDDCPICQFILFVGTYLPPTIDAPRAPTMAALAPLPPLASERTRTHRAASAQPRGPPPSA